MKKKGTAFSIPEPCNEGWNNMEPVEKGRFCGSCAKVVVDFSVMSDFQIMDIMQKSKDPVCGRMSSAQMDRVMYPLQSPGSSYFSLRALVLGTALTTFSALHATGQTDPVQVAAKPVKTDQPRFYKGEIVAQHQPLNTITGYVVDAVSGDSLSGAAIAVFAADGTLLSSFITNGKGYFEIINSGETSLPDYILVTHAGYISEEIKVTDLHAAVTVFLNQEHVMIMGKMIRREEK